MIPEEKAKELVEKFKPLVRTPRFGKRHADPYYLAKEAAVICVDEIMRSVEIVYQGKEMRLLFPNYWQQVKKAINKL